jgi:hypothetical protein
MGAYVNGANRDIVMSKDIVRRACLLGASIWVEMYCTDDDTDKNRAPAITP